MEATITPKPITENTLFYGDNLAVPREYIPDESGDPIYLVRSSWYTVEGGHADGCA
jgi:hypothetical protein